MSKKMLAVPTGQFGSCWAGRAKITGIYWIYGINGMEMEGLREGRRKEGVQYTGSGDLVDYMAEMSFPAGRKKTVIAACFAVPCGEIQLVT